MTGDPASPARILGKGLMLEATEPSQDIGLDIAFDRGPAARGLRVVAGDDALTQDLRVALCTGLGVDPLNRNFGSDAFKAMADETDPLMLRERIRVAIIRVLKADSRVRRVVEVRVGGESRPFQGASQGRGTALDVLAIYETVLREVASISIEGLGNA